MVSAMLMPAAENANLAVAGRVGEAYLAITNFYYTLAKFSSYLD